VNIAKAWEAPFLRARQVRLSRIPGFGGAIAVFAQASPGSARAGGGEFFAPCNELRRAHKNRGLNIGFAAAAN
jgi:hypothetical protein